MCTGNGAYFVGGTPHPPVSGLTNRTMHVADIPNREMGTYFDSALNAGNLLQNGKQKSAEFAPVILHTRQARLLSMRSRVGLCSVPKFIVTALITTLGMRRKYKEDFE